MLQAPMRMCVALALAIFWTASSQAQWLYLKCPPLLNSPYDTHIKFSERPNSYSPKFAREMLRQFVAVTAIEEGGYYIHDENLFEQPAEGGATLDFYLTFNNKRDRDPVEQVHEAEVMLNGEQIATHESRNSLPYPWDYLALSDDYQKLAKEVVLPQLPQNGNTPPPPWDAEAKVSDDIKKQLDSWEYTDLFCATQAVHNAIRKNGASIERYQALVQGYGKMSFLKKWETRCQWATYGARAMAYAHRLKTLAPNDIASHWTLMHAYVLTEQQGAALHLHRELQKQFPNHADSTPGWVEPALAMMTNKRDKLRQLAFNRGPQQAFAATLLASYNEWNLPWEMWVEENTKLFSLFRHNTALIDQLAWNGGISAERRFTEWQLDEESQRAYGKFAVNRNTIDPGNIARVRPNLPAILALTELANQMITEENTNPSFQDLTPAAWGSHTLERNMRNCMARGNVLADTWGVESESFVKASLAICEGHPLKMWMLTYLHRNRQAPLVNIARRLPFEEMNPRIMLPVVGRVPYDAQLANVPVEFAANSLRDSHSQTASDEYFSTWSIDGDYWAIRWNNEAPHMPFIDFDHLTEDDVSDETIARIAEEHGSDPKITRELYSVYKKRGDLDKALTYARRFAKASQTVSGYENLAELQLWLEGKEAWMATMEQALQMPSQGLTRSSCCLTIAGTLSSFGEHEKALHYAQLAAESGSGQSMTALAWCLYNNGRPIEANQAYQARIERYGRRHPSWYCYFLLRIGMQKEAIANWDQSANQVYDDSLKSKNSQATWWAISGQDERLLNWLQSENPKNLAELQAHDLFAYAIVADHKQEHALRDQLLAMAQARDPEEDGTTYVDIAAKFADFFKNPTAEHPMVTDPNWIEPSQVYLRMYAHWATTSHGLPSIYTDDLKTVAAIENTTIHVQLAVRLAREQGIPESDLKIKYFQDRHRLEP